MLMTTCMKDECTICGRVLPLYTLRRCQICSKLHCRSCMTTNLWGEQRDLVCLHCARRIVSPRRVGSKYASLREYLWRRGQFTSVITVTFRVIEGIIQSDLPLGALRSEEWWNNSESSPQGYAWTNVGWKVQSIDLKGRTVTFKKEPINGAAQMQRRRRKTRAVEKPFTPVPEKPLRIRQPSKTRIARAVARAKNVERRMAAPQYRGKVKARRAYEKRLYKPEAKPTSQG